MKKLTCEMCGSVDLIKQDGVFVCQTCGCKYSVEEAKKMMVEGVVQVEGTVKVDNSDKEDTYKEMAINAYNAGNTNEAYQYFLKVLEINPTEYQSIFYKGMCQGWETSLARPRIGEAVAAYYQAERYIPDEIAQTVKEIFISDLIRLMAAWFNKAQENYFDVDDWYQSNTSIYYTYTGAAEQIIKFIDGFMDTVVSSTSGDLLKEVGELYCSACEAMCGNIIIWCDYSKERAIFSGLKSQQKQPYIRDYETMIFEVRKYYPEFRKPESKYGVIDRMDPPTSIGAHNLRTTDVNYQKCLDADKVIEQRLQKYNKDKFQKEKNEREQSYWDAHPEAKGQWADLKENLDECTRVANNARAFKISKDADVKRYEEVISGLDRKISESNDVIAKQRKKIFGKAKAQEVISQAEADIASYQKQISDVVVNLNNAKSERNEANSLLNEADFKLLNAKNAYDSFMQKCGL